MRIELFKNNSNSNIVVEEFYDYDDTLVINAGMNTTVLSNKSRVQSSICTSHSSNIGSRLSMAADMAAAVVTSRERRRENFFILESESRSSIWQNVTGKLETRFWNLKTRVEAGEW